MQGSLLEFQGSIKDVSRLFHQTWEFYHLVPKSFSSLCSVSHQIPEFFYANFGLRDNNPTPINNKLLVYGFYKSIWWWLMQEVPKIHIVFGSILFGPEACLKHFQLAWPSPNLPAQLQLPVQPDLNCQLGPRLLLYSCWGCLCNQG